MLHQRSGKEPQTQGSHTYCRQTHSTNHPPPSGQATAWQERAAAPTLHTKERRKATTFSLRRRPRCRLRPRRPLTSAQTPPGSHAPAFNIVHGGLCARTRPAIRMTPPQAPESRLRQDRRACDALRLTFTDASLASRSFFSFRVSSFSRSCWWAWPRHRYTVRQHMPRLVSVDRLVVGERPLRLADGNGRQSEESRSPAELDPYLVRPFLCTRDRAGNKNIVFDSACPRLLHAWVYAR